jgi:hypothetical protein
MLVAEACFIDGERAPIQRFRLGEPVGGLQQPWLASSMACARRISGSARACSALVLNSTPRAFISRAVRSSSAIATDIVDLCTSRPT